MIEFEHMKLETKREFIRNCCYTTPEALEVLEISRARLSHMIKYGKLTPVKKSGAISLFLFDDLLEKKKELIFLRKKYRPWEVSGSGANE